MAKVSAFRHDHQDLSLDAIGRQESTASSVGGITPFGKRPTPLVDGRWFTDDAPIVVEGRVAPVKVVSAFEDPSESGAAGGFLASRQSTARPEDLKIDDEPELAVEEAIITGENGSSSAGSQSVQSMEGFDEAWAALYAPPERNTSSTNLHAQVSPTTSTPPGSSRLAEQQQQQVGGSAFLPSASSMFAGQSPQAPTTGFTPVSHHVRARSQGFSYDPYAAPIFSSAPAPYAPAAYGGYPQQHQAAAFGSTMGSRQSSGDLHVQQQQLHYAPVAEDGTFDHWAPHHYQHTMSGGYEAPSSMMYEDAAAPWVPSHPHQHHVQAPVHARHLEGCTCDHCEAAAVVQARERAAPHVPLHHHHQATTQRHSVAPTTTTPTTAPRSHHVSQALHLQQQHRRTTGAALPTDVTVLAALSGGAHTQQELRQHLSAAPAVALSSSNVAQQPMLLRFVPPQLPPLVLITVMTESATSPEEAAVKYVHMAARWYAKLAPIQDLFLETKEGLTEAERLEAIAAARCPAPQGCVLELFTAASTTSSLVDALSDEQTAALRQWVQAARSWWLHHFEHAQTSGRQHNNSSAHPSSSGATASYHQAPTAMRATSAAASGGAPRHAHHASSIHQAPSNAPFVTHAATTQHAPSAGRGGAGTSSRRR